MVFPAARARELARPCRHPTRVHTLRMIAGETTSNTQYMEQQTPSSVEDQSISVLDAFPKEEAVDHYEILVLISGTIVETDAAALFNTVKELAQSLGGMITKEENMGRRTLGYTVAGSSQGNYFVAEFDMKKSAVVDLNNKLRMRKDIARFLVTKKRVKSPEELADEARVADKIAKRKMLARAAAAANPEKSTAEEKEPFANKSRVRTFVRKPVAAALPQTEKVATSTESAQSVTPAEAAAPQLAEKVTPPAEAAPIEEKAKPKTMEEIDREIEKLLSDDITF